MAQYTYPSTSTTISGVATEAKQDVAIASLVAIEASVAASITTVDFLDSGVVDTSSTNITAAGLTVVASLAADVTELEIFEDIGEYMAITDGSDVILAYFPLGGGRVKVSIPSGTALKLASKSGSTINVGKIVINFLG